MSGDDAAARAWSALEAHHREQGAVDLRAAFAADPEHAARFTASAAGWTLDHSKNLVSEATLAHLAELARACGMAERIEAMFRGERINTTESRAVLHTALRAPRGSGVVLDGRDVTHDVHDVLDRVLAFADAVRDGSLTGHGGARIEAVVNLGIGGSDLGPRMVVAALRGACEPALDVRFVANVDPQDFADTTRGLDPARTLFVVCSKTFTTAETLANARAARQWCVDALGEEAVERHFAAVTTNLEGAAEFGIPAERVFGFWDWVGGRYSLWSAVGLSIALALGADAHRALLAGAREMDEHFREAPFERNLPLLLAGLGVWYRNLLGAETTAVIPYDHYLARLPEFLQQLDMESNGKRVRRDGRPASRATGPIVWGAVGTNGQHAFFQLLHQGTALVPADLIGFLASAHPRDDAHTQLLANLFAQAEALAFGRTAEEVAADGVAAELVPHRTFPGNRPTNLLVAERLEPRTLGALLALYEHKVFAQGVLWDVDSFDQWGVELGKRLATRLAAELDGADAPGPAHDGSTRAWIRRVRESRTR